jgi:tetratricopeptide (TPR) repeat protein
VAIAFFLVGGAFMKGPANKSRKPASAKLSREAQDPRLHAAVAAQEAGRLDEAERLCRQILADDPVHLPATHLLGILAGQTGRNALAIELLTTVVTREPRSVEALNQLSSALRIAGRHAEAIDVGERAVRLRPRLASAHMNLALAYHAAERLPDAIASFEKAAALVPMAAETRYLLAVALERQGREAEAVKSYRTALARDPRHRAAKEGLAAALQNLGHFDEATALYETILSDYPKRTALYPNLVYAKKLAERDRPLIERMQALLGEAGLSDQDRANLHFALGKVFDDLGEPATAMRHFDEANRLKHELQTFDRAEHVKTVGWITRTFTMDFFVRHNELGSPSELPVLIVGMPRSGTTLVEQILSSHSNIGAGGELTYWGKQAGNLGPKLARGVTSDEAAEAAKSYLTLLGGRAAGRLRVTDKMPSNFLRLGLIHLIFPRARIIHCRRNPMDTALSIYFTQFTEPQEFAYDRGDIVFYYELYRRTMAHWRRVLPADRLLEIDYEALIAERQAVSRQMVAFCGLEWDDACLHPEANRRAVKTASVWQARQPVYRSSVERWRRYEPWLGELRQLLPELAGKDDA